MLGMKVAAFTMVRSSLPTGAVEPEGARHPGVLSRPFRRRQLPDELGMTELAEKGSPFQRASSVGRGGGVGRDLGVGLTLGVGVALGVPVGVGVAVGVAVGEGVTVGVAVGVAVAVAVGEGVTVGVAVGVGVGVALGVAVGVAVGVGVGVEPDCTSKEPISMRPFTTRSKPGPRWSKNGGGVKFGSPASIAGLLFNSSWVNVGPPLFCNGPSSGSVLI